MARPTKHEIECIKKDNWWVPLAFSLMLACAIGLWIGTCNRRDNEQVKTQIRQLRQYLDEQDQEELAREVLEEND